MKIFLLGDRYPAGNMNFCRSAPGALRVSVVVLAPQTTHLPASQQRPWLNLDDDREMSTQAVNTKREGHCECGTILFVQALPE